MLRQVSKIVLTLKEGDWTIELPQDARTSKEGDTAGPKWLQSLEHSRFISIDHGAPALT
jgi:hypothetical protein